jgi:hypothetical protein
MCSILTNWQMENLVQDLATPIIPTLTLDICVTDSCHCETAP